MSYNKNDLINKVEEVSKKYCNGETPTLEEMREYGNVTSQPYKRIWDSWNKAVEDIGFEPNKSRGQERIPKKDILKEINRVSEEELGGKTPSISDFNEFSKFGSANTCKVKFGSWNEALKQAGLQPIVEIEQTRGISDEKYKSELIDLADELNRAPHLYDVSEKLDWSHRVYIDRWGPKWSDVIDKIVPYELPDPSDKQRISKEKLLNEIHRLEEELGYPPTKIEMNSIGKFSDFPYRNSFGSYGDAIKQAGYEDCLNKRKIKEKNNGTLLNYGENWRDVKQDVLKRDNFVCRVCKKNFDKNPAVHHITPRRMFIYGELSENKMNNKDNLISLCRYCHGKLEGKFQEKDHREFERLAKEYLGIEKDKRERSLFDY